MQNNLEEDEVKEQNNTESAQVVLYEGSDFYIVADCEIIRINDEYPDIDIDENTQTRIEKNGVKITLMVFDKRL